MTTRPEPRRRSGMLWPRPPTHSLQARARPAALDLRPFDRRRTEMLARSLFDRRHGEFVVLDLGIAPVDGRSASWEVEVVALGRQSALRRRKPTRTVEWSEIPELFDVGEM